MSVAAPARRLWTPRLAATLALFVISATFFSVIVGYALVSQADDRQSLERRAALLGAIEDIRGTGADFSALDTRHIKGMERTAGLKDLRFETEPVAGDREIQSVLNKSGRIIGWFSWEPDRSMSNALSQLRPLLGLTGVFLVGFAGIALWQVRRAVGDLSRSVDAAGLDRRAGGAGWRHGGPRTCAARRTKPRRTDALCRSRAPHRQKQATRRHRALRVGNGGRVRRASLP